MSIKYCPECGAEYQEWAVKCIDCGVALVDTKPGSKPKSKNKDEIVIKGGRKYVREPLVVIASFTNSLEAEFNKGILESEDIPSMVTSTDAIIAYQPDASAVGTIHLVVKESDAEKAKEILNSIEKDISDSDIPEDGIIEGEIPEENDPEGDNSETENN
jgi:hypothetical protein